MIRTGNPSLRGNVFSQVNSGFLDNAMSLQGAINKAFILFGLIVFSVWWVWQNPSRFIPFLFPTAIAGFVLAIITIFKKEWARFTSPAYALVQGVFLGIVSYLFDRQYQGVAIQAVGLTLGVFFSMLIAYRSGLIKATRGFKLGVISATGGIALVYFISIILRFFGAGISFIHQAGPLGIGFSLFVVVIASLNLILDFDFIEKGAIAGAPKFMEWYAAFGLMVTLVWLYLEMLRLLAKLQQRR